MLPLQRTTITVTIILIITITITTIISSLTTTTTITTTSCFHSPAAAICCLCNAICSFSGCFSKTGGSSNLMVIFCI